MDEKKIRNVGYFLVFSCGIVFLFSIALKRAYVSAQVTIESEYGMTPSQTRIGSLLYYCIYAVSQVLLGLFFKKINVKKVFFAATVLSAVTYSLMTVCNAPWQLWVIQSLNGVIQAPLWSGCVYFVSKYVKATYLSTANTIMAFANPMGNSVAAGVVALFVHLKLWKMSFLVLSVGMVLAGVVFIFAYKRADKLLQETAKPQPVKQNEGETQAREKLKTVAATRSTSRKTFVIYTLIVFFVAAISAIVSGALEVSTQIIPELLFKVHGLPQSLSILVTIFVPFLKTGIILSVYQIYYRTRNLFLLSLFICIFTTLVAVPTMFFANKSIVCAILLPMIIASTTHSLTGLFGTQFALAISHKYSAGSTGAIVNGVACMCSGIMPFISGAILDLGGQAAWTGNYIFLIAMCAVSTLMTLVMVLTKKKNPLLND